MNKVLSPAARTAAALMLFAGALVATAASTAPPAAASQAAEFPAIFDQLEGDWVGTGTLCNARAGFTMQWERALHGQFFRLRFTNSMFRNGEMSPVLSAEAFYRVNGDGELVADWFDTRGEKISIEARVEDDQLVADWSSSSESGRTVYRVKVLLPGGRMRTVTVYGPSGRLQG